MLNGMGELFVRRQECRLLPKAQGEIERIVDCPVVFRRQAVGFWEGIRSSRHLDRFRSLGTFLSPGSYRLTVCAVGFAPVAIPSIEILAAPSKPGASTIDAGTVVLVLLPLIPANVPSILAQKW